MPTHVGLCVLSRKIPSGIASMNFSLGDDVASQWQKLFLSINERQSTFKKDTNTYTFSTGNLS